MQGVCAGDKLERAITVVVLAAIPVYLVRKRSQRRRAAREAEVMPPAVPAPSGAYAHGDTLQPVAHAR